MHMAIESPCLVLSADAALQQAYPRRSQCRDVHLHPRNGQREHEEVRDPQDVRSHGQASQRGSTSTLVLPGLQERPLSPKGKT